MGVDIKTVTQIGNAINRQAREVRKDLSLCFVAHRTGQRADTIAVEEHDVRQHPAGNIAVSMLKKCASGDDTGILGLASKREKACFGLVLRDHMMGLITVNADQFEDEIQARASLYHMAWHALDLASLRDRPEYRARFRDGPMVPQRSPMNQARANLRADVFSAVMMALQGDKRAITNLALKRGEETLTPQTVRRAEDYPYIIACEAAHFAFSEHTKTIVPRARMMKLALRIADEVGQTFDESAIRQWWAFSTPAQDMAWRGHSKEQILGAAINTSEDPYVRSIGLLITEITGMTALSGTDLLGTYNAFTDPEVNERLHREAVDEVFEDVIAQGLYENGPACFLTAANEQNRSLTDGRVLGWCAGALQAAAKAFENALANGKSPGQAARLEFEVQRGSTPWSAIRKLGEQIIEQRRYGFAVTFADVLKLCGQSQELALVMDSINATIKDPGFSMQPALVRDFTPSPGLHVSPSFGPKSAPPKPEFSAPVLSLAPAPSPGGSKQQDIRRRVLQTRQQPQKVRTGSTEDEIY